MYVQNYYTKLKVIIYSASIVSVELRVTVYTLTPEEKNSIQPGMNLVNMSAYAQYNIHFL